ncbi:DUF4430 domain-containing protein [Natronoflexus pectinivorans]|uniref:Uncharacterized protein DUF4430 n=1 Tax=Natronoflexus pectinivorans TaxID=682526 RepID=A0A4R2GIC7_9BACT|nr:DUF4430 domain-containing protein [Natronoflexus pectinivorans]TCO08043.1 uncharacterized protein DUF4430 [Natronoflexus pectinivorans]
MLNPGKLPLLLFVVIIFMARCGGQISEGESHSADRYVEVYLHYGSDADEVFSKVHWYEGLTAMAALQYCAAVSTRPVGEYVFVSAIDTFHNQRGGMVWYYTVNGDPATKLAISNSLNAGDVVRWRYCDDVCSTK